MTPPNYKTILPSAYRDKKVFLTGHTGFKGAWMLAILHYLGAEVMGYALEPENDNDLYNLIDGDDLCQSVMADIRKKDILAMEIKNFQPDFVFHLAAQSLVRRSFEMPAQTYETNVLGTAYVLDAFRQLEKPCVSVLITTDKVYENLESLRPYKETDPLGGFDPYSSSKAAAEIAIASYRRSFFHPDKYANHHQSVASARAGNVIGGGDRAPDRIIPDFVRALENEEPLVVRNPHSIRPWQHVLEPVVGYLYLGAKMLENPSKFASAYNFGPQAEDQLSVQELVEKALAIWGSGTYETAIDPNAPHEAKLLKLDISKAESELGWAPKWNSAKALQMTLDWYKNYKEGAMPLTMKQVEEYFDVN